MLVYVNFRSLNNPMRSVFGENHVDEKPEADRGRAGTSPSDTRAFVTVPRRWEKIQCTGIACRGAAGGFRSPGVTGEGDTGYLVTPDLCRTDGLSLSFPPRHSASGLSVNGV